MPTQSQRVSDRSPVLGCHVYQCDGCGHVELVPHSCKSRFCPTCGKHATDVWASQVLNGLLDVAYHHLIMAIPWQLRFVINKLWHLTWYAYIGASLLDPRFSIQYIGRYTKRAVMAEYRIVYDDGKIVRFSFKDDAKGGKFS